MDPRMKMETPQRGCCREEGVQNVIMIVKCDLRRESTLKVLLNNMRGEEQGV
jgi:hypothetical protein